MRDLTEVGLIELHNIVESQFPSVITGIKDYGLIKSIVERPHLKLYNKHEPFDNIYKKAAALMEAIIRWHPFNDGNKRTGLLAAFVYLQANKHYLVIPLDSVKFTVNVAENQNQTEEETNKLIEEIAEWIEKRTATNREEYNEKMKKYVRNPTLKLFLLLFTGFGIFYVYRKINDWFAVKMHEEYRKDIPQMIRFLYNTINDSLKAMPEESFDVKKNN